MYNMNIIKTKFCAIGVEWTNLIWTLIPTIQIGITYDRYFLFRFVWLKFVLEMYYTGMGTLPKENKELK